MTNPWRRGRTIAPTVEWRMSGKGSGYGVSDRARGSAERTVTSHGGLVVPVYRTRHGGVDKVTVLFLNSLKDNGPIKANGYSVRVDGRVVAEYDKPFTLRPGQGLPVTVWLGRGDTEGRVREQYWDAFTPTTPHPSWAPDKLRAGVGYKKVGPFEVVGDKDGSQGGGQFTDYPFFMDWRRHPAGWDYTYQSMERWMQRSYCIATDAEAQPTWFSDPEFTLKRGTGPPDGYAYDPVGDKHWRGARELGQYSTPDGQHFIRIVRDALMLAPYDPMAADFCRWALGWAKLAWGWDKERDDRGRSYWGVRQLYRDLRENPGPHDCLGRELAWLCALAWTIEPESRFSGTLEKIVAMATQGDHGIPFLTRQSIYWAEKPYGPFEPGSLKAQTREWVYMYWAMQQRPSLHAAAARLREYMGDYQFSCMDGEGNHVDAMQGLLHLNFGHLGPWTSWEEMLQHARVRPVDGDGSNGINYALYSYYKDVPI